MSSFLLSCKKSRESKAKELVKQYILKNSNDADSYDPIDFGSLDTFKNSVLFSDYYQEVLEDFHEAQEGSTWKDEAQYELHRLSKDSILNPLSFSMTHEFRATNGFGAKVIFNKKFYFNADIDSIISVQ